ncbi:MAG: CorA family divalent cation transporter [Acholeplasmataceae bacterium]|jgi:magnesium transporter|nr:CorA family divalent cation transporter [Acholeplasmataceae bacterium]
MNLSAYLKPKTNVYTGVHQHIETEIIHYQYDGNTYEILDRIESTKNVKHYIQIIGLTNIEKILGIKDVYHIDPLIIEDVFNVNQRNKIELKDDYLFGAFNLSFLENNQVVEDYMSLIMTKDTIISFHETKPKYLEPLISLLKEYKELKERTIDFLFFQILDIITDGHLDIYDVLDDEIIEFEEQILETKTIEQDDFYLVRKQMLKLKNQVTPILEQLDKVLSKKTTHFHIDNSPYFDDLKDHLQRLDIRLNQSREAMHHLLDLHMNNQSTKMNKIMTTLTIFSAIFIPLSFLTGFFGMNFIHFGILSYKHAIVLFSISCLILSSLMIIYFKKKKWF